MVNFILYTLFIYFMGVGLGYLSCWIRYKRDLNKFLESLAEAQQQQRVKDLYGRN